jgi:arsenate reductase
LAIDLVKSVGMPVDGLRSKSWDVFARPGAPEMDFVFTVCDNAAGEVCPLWPGRPITAHWGIPDPVVVEGDVMKKKTAFQSAFGQLERRIRLFTSLRISELDRLALKKKVDEIGKS